MPSLRAFLSLGLLAVFSSSTFSQGVTEEPNYMRPKVWTYLQRGQFPGNFQELNAFDLVIFNRTQVQGSWEDYDYVDSIQALKSRNDSMLVLAYAGIYCNCSNWTPYYQADDAWQDSLDAHPEWYLHEVNGDTLCIEPVTCVGGQLNFTKVDMARELAQYLYDSVFAKSPMIWDGFQLDYLTGTAFWYNNYAGTPGESIDANQDSVADSQAWLDSAWAVGVDTFCARLRALVGDTVLILNNGEAPLSSFQYLNGHKHEGFPGDGGNQEHWWGAMFDEEYGFLAGDTLYSDEPFRMNIIMQNIPKSYDPDTLSTFTDPYDDIGNLDALIEKGVASALLGDGFYCAEGLLNAAYHWNAENDTVWEGYNTAYWMDHYDQLRGRLGTAVAQWDSSTIGARLYFTREYTGGEVALRITPAGDCYSAKVDVDPDLSDLSNGGGTFAPGDTMEVTWDASDVREDSSTFRVFLYLSRDGGTSFSEQIVQNTTNDGLYEWVVKDSLSGNCKIRAVVLDTLLLMGQANPPDTTEYLVFNLYGYDTTGTFGIMGCGSASESSMGVGEDTLLVCPAGDADTVVVTITVKDVNAYPVPGLSGDSMYVVLSSDSGNINFCSNDTLWPAGWTDGDGEITVREAHIGGCGKVYLKAYVCGDVYGYDTVLVNSPDINASGTVNFTDTNKFLVLKNAGQGWCGDYDHDGDVDSDDQTIYVPHLNGSHHCPAGGKRALVDADIPDGSAMYRIVATVVGDQELGDPARISYALAGGPVGAFELRLSVLDSGTRLVRWVEDPESAVNLLAFVDPTGSSGVIARVGLAESEGDDLIPLGTMIVDATGSGDPAISVSAVVEAPDGVYYTVGSVRLDAGRPIGEVPVPESVFLRANLPNPFNPATVITFGLPRATPVSLVILDLAGREVRTLVQEMRPAGVHEVVWDGRGNDGVAVASGVYFCHLVVDGTAQTQKMLLLR